MRLVSLLIAALLAGGVIWWVSAGARSDVPASEMSADWATPSESTPVAEPSTAVAETDDQTASQPSVRPNERTPLPQRRFLRVTDGSGTPVQNADVSAETAPSTTHRTDERGTLALDPEATTWVATHPSFLASGIALPPDDESAPPLVLPPTRALSVLVLRDGAPVDGAVVHSRGAVPVDGRKIPVARTTRSDARGLSAIAPLPGRSSLRAELEGATSEVWVGEHPRTDGPVVLELHPTFSASGRVVGAPNAAALAGATVAAVHPRDEDAWNRPRDEWRRHALSTGVSADGTWSLAGIPWTGPGPVVFRLTGPGTQPDERVVEVASPEANVRVEHEWLAGNPLSFHVVDAEGGDVAGVELVACWRPGTEWKRCSVEADREGRAVFDTVPAQTVFVRAHAEGFGAAVFGPYTPPADTGEFTIALQPAARVRGTCLHDGSPVADFTVTYWGADPTNRSVARFAGRADGAFELDDAPSGELHVFAHSEELPRSPTVDLTAAPGEDVQVALELPLGIPTRGRVIDAATGTPLAGVRVQVQSRFQQRAFEDWGPEVLTGTDGTFDGVEVSPHGSYVLLRTEGHETKWLDPDASVDAGEVDLGLVSLFPTGNVRVRLVSPDVPSFGDFQATLWGRSALLPASPKGELVFPDQAPGRALLLVHTPARDRIDVSLSLEPGADWTFPVSVGTSRAVVVRLVPAPGVEVPDDLWLSVSHTDLSGCSARCITEFGEDRTATLDFLVGDALQLSAVRTSGEVLGVRWARLAGDGPIRLDLPLSGEVCELLLLDPDDRPVANASVSITGAGDPGGASVLYDSDVDGVVRLVGFPDAPIGVRVVADGSAVCALQTVDLAAPERPLVVRVDTRARVRARLLERDVPAVGASIAAREPGMRQDSAHATSGAAGAFEIAHLSPTPWQLRVDGGGWWPVRVMRTATIDGAVEDVQVRRMGGVRVRVTRQGLAVAGATVELDALEWDDASVATWVHEGRATAGAGGFVTGNDGLVEVSGLPNGPYRWTVRSAEQTLATGTLEVPPLTVATFDVTLP